MKGDDISIGSEQIEREISECPFSGSPVEVCAQYEAFLNGLIGEIEPNCELMYDRMIDWGDRTCHWVIRKKLGLAREKTEDDGALKALKLRFAKGEITPEQYRQFRDILLEM